MNCIVPKSDKNSAEVSSRNFYARIVCHTATLFGPISTGTAQRVPHENAACPGTVPA